MKGDKHPCLTSPNHLDYQHSYKQYPAGKWEALIKRRLFMKNGDYVCFRQNVKYFSSMSSCRTVAFHLP